MTRQTAKARGTSGGETGAVVARGHRGCRRARPSAPKQNKTRDASPILAGKGVSSSGPGRTSAQATANAPRTSLGTGIAKPVGARIDWARLIRHIYLDDVLACPCGARRRVLAHIEHPDVIAAILEHLGLPTDPAPIARARSPGAASF